MTLSNDALYTLLVCSLRYAMGRRSYITGDVADLIRTHDKHLRQSQREVLARDLRDALQRAIERGQTLGEQCDHDDWRSLLIWLESAPECGTDHE